MGKERQSMSDIVYNYSKFRSMEQNYYRSEKGRKKEKEREKVKSKEL